jgi:hypothetical protein
MKVAAAQRPHAMTARCGGAGHRRLSNRHLSGRRQAERGMVSAIRAVKITARDRTAAREPPGRVDLASSQLEYSKTLTTCNVRKVLRRRSNPPVARPLERGVDGVRAPDRDCVARVGCADRLTGVVAL